MNSHTNRARAIAQRDYLTFVEKNKKGDLTAWMTNMQLRGLAANTIRQRLSLVRKWLNVKETVMLPIRQNIRELKWFNPEQVHAFLTAIPNNESGRRDFVLITIILITGLRLGQIRYWRWSEFSASKRILFTKRDYFPKAALDIVQTIVPHKVAHSLDMYPPTDDADEDFIFTAHQRRQQMATHGHKTSFANIKNRPLSPQEINRRIKRYASLAGLEAQGISAESLRRTHKRLGENILIPLVQDLLAIRNAGPVRWRCLERDSRLHGIGRRGFRS